MEKFRKISEERLANIYSEAEPEDKVNTTGCSKHILSFITTKNIYTINHASNIYTFKKTITTLTQK